MAIAISDPDDSSIRSKDKNSGLRQWKFTLEDQGGPIGKTSQLPLEQTMKSIGKKLSAFR